MKYFENDIDYSGAESVLLKNCIILEERIFGITKIDEGKIEFSERCDDHFCKTFTQEEAIELLEEAIDWINNGEGK